MASQVESKKCESKRSSANLEINIPLGRLWSTGRLLFQVLNELQTASENRITSYREFSRLILSASSAEFEFTVIHVSFRGKQHKKKRENQRAQLREPKIV